MKTLRPLKPEYSVDKKKPDKGEKQVKTLSTSKVTPPKVSTPKVPTPKATTQKESPSSMPKTEPEVTSSPGTSRKQSPAQQVEPSILDKVASWGYRLAILAIVVGVFMIHFHSQKGLSQEERELKHAPQVQGM